MADISILDPSVASAPKQFTVHGAQEIILKGVTASFDGSAAAGSFVPSVQIIDPAGVIVGTYTADTTLAAGASADVSWFPGVVGGGGELDTTDGVTDIASTTELFIGAGLGLSNPSPGVAELSADFGNIIHGRVSSGTNPTFIGTGFTGVRTGTGAYTISFSPPLSQAPAIVISAYGDGANAVNFASAVQNGSPSTGNSFTVLTFNPAAAVARDCGFDFMAIPTGASTPGGPHFPVQSNVQRDTSYNAFPWCCYLQDGTTIIASYRKATSHLSVDGKIVIQKSTDGGQTWSGETVLFTPPGGQDYREPSIVLTNTGRLVMNFFAYDGTNALGIYTTHSDDNGVTWSALPALLTPYTATIERGVTSGACLFSSAGTLIMPVYGQNTLDTSDRMGVLRSTDNGATWGSLVNISAANSHLSEATLIQFNTGTIRAYIRDNTAASPIRVCESTDDGVTWGAISVLGWNVTPGRPAAVLTLTTGTVFLMYRQLATSYPAYRYSTDGGTTWSSEVAYSVTGTDQYAGGFPRPGSDQLAMVVSAENLGTSTIAYLLFFTWVVA